MKKFLMAVLVVMFGFIATTSWGADGQAAPHKPKTIHEETATAHITNRPSDCSKIEAVITVVRKAQTNELNVGILQTDECAAARITDAYGIASIPNSEFQITGLDYAKLSSVIKVYDQASNSFFDVFVDMEWITNPSLFLGTWNSVDHELGTTKGYHSILYRPSMLSGTIQFNEITVNPEPYSDWGSLNSNNTITPKASKK